MSFRVGDEVRIIRGPDYGHMVGDIGEITKIPGRGFFNIEVVVERSGEALIGYYAADELEFARPEHRHAAEEVKETVSAFSTQVGGSHYKDMAIQPTEYIVKNGLNFIEGNVIKYVTRYKFKGGLEDLKKARHYLEILIEMEESSGVYAD